MVLSSDFWLLLPSVICGSGFCGRSKKGMGGFDEKMSLLILASRRSVPGDALARAARSGPLSEGSLDHVNLRVSASLRCCVSDV